MSDIIRISDFRIVVPTPFVTRIRVEDPLVAAQRFMTQYHDRMVADATRNAPEVHPAKFVRDVMGRTWVF